MRKFKSAFATAIESGIMQKGYLLVLLFEGAATKMLSKMMLRT